MMFGLFAIFVEKPLHCNSSDQNLNPFPFDVFGFFGTLGARATQDEFSKFADPR